MKAFTVLCRLMICMFYFAGFAQQSDRALASTVTTKPKTGSDKKTNESPVIEGYSVEEVINMPFGKRITKYEVSKLDMVSTYDLGPNNTRTVTPIYKKTKIKPIEADVQAEVEVVAEAKKTIVEPPKADIIPVMAAAKYIEVDISGTYSKILDKGYKSVDMLKKVADKSYFAGNMEEAVKYYAQLFEISTDQESIYYHRYSESLKAINQKDKANEIMALFESKSHQK